MTIEKAVIDCCDGFTTPRPTPMELATGGAHSLFKRFRFRITSGGCPIRKSVCCEQKSIACNIVGISDCIVSYKVRWYDFAF